MNKREECSVYHPKLKERKDSKLRVGISARWVSSLKSVETEKIANQNQVSNSSLIFFIKMNLN